VDVGGLSDDGFTIVGVDRIEVEVETLGRGSSLDRVFVHVIICHLAEITEETTGHCKARLSSLMEMIAYTPSCAGTIRAL